MNWYLGVLKKYVDFSGRSRRKEYWYFVLFNLIATIIFAVIDGILMSATESAGAGLLGLLYALAVFLPALGVSVRRLHDIDRSGWWLLISLVPLVGLLVLLFFFVQDSKPGENRFGSNPKLAEA